MTLLILLFCLILVGMLPLGIRANYKDGAANLWVVIGPISWHIYPKQRTNSKRDYQVRKGKFKAQAKAKGNKRSLFDYWPLAQLLLDFLLDFHARLRINFLEFKLVLAGSDPSDVGINYGRAWVTYGNLMPVLERCFKIQKKEIQILCDYTADKTVVSGYIDMTIRFAQLLSIGIYHGIKLLRKYFEITKVKDGVTV